ncbi:Lactonase, 7-bladed beta-propeller [Ceratobasidium theobromae]|uniref:Lactonase, 7-bladed beta-propeller n=1 Tax=Ceratobasidium theobromae TaxID=1582974 RepID=A0A5N5QCF4_9AGAM|nr:Lactonase, 7-bladed beta-propeller [Ceratobasidium theobromae]
MTVHRILVASYTPNITTLEFDDVEHTLKPIALSPAGTNPSWIAAHPTERTLVLATNEVTDGKVHLFRLQQDGKLKLLESVGSAGEDPAHLAVLDSQVIVGNYSSGSILAVPFSTTAPHFLAALDPIQLTGTGPNLSRQASSHPHQIFPHGSQLLVPDLGADRVIRFEKNDKGEWTEVGDIKASKPGAGPRHVQVYDRILYVIDELTNTLSAHVHTLSTPSQYLASVSTLPLKPHANHLLSAAIESSVPESSTPRGPSTALPLLAAELLLVTEPEPLLFATNRNEVHPEGDSISIFTPLKGDDILTFKMIGSVRTGLKHARGAAFGGPGDKWLVVGGADKGGVKVFERSGARGEVLSAVAHMPGIVAPTGFLWV